MNPPIVADCKVSLVADGPGRYSIFLRCEAPPEGLPALLKIQGVKAETCEVLMAEELGPQFEAAAAAQQLRVAEAAAALAAV